MMRYAIVESGGKQYKAVEGEGLEVDRLPDEEGKQIKIERILMMADGTDFVIGTPVVSGIEVRATVLDHFSGRKVTHFRYSPKKRIRVRGGHRQQYTRLLVDFIGSQGEVRKPTKAEATPVGSEDEKAPTEKKAAKASVKEGPKKTAQNKAGSKKPAAGSSAGKKPAKHSAR
jgi:large subunit ribosomal protein L21